MNSRRPILKGATLVGAVVFATTSAAAISAGALPGVLHRPAHSTPVAATTVGVRTSPTTTGYEHAADDPATAAGPSSEHESTTATSSPRAGDQSTASGETSDRSLPRSSGKHPDGNGREHSAARVADGSHSVDDVTAEKPRADTGIHSARGQVDHPSDARIHD